MGTGYCWIGGMWIFPLIGVILIFVVAFFVLKLKDF